MPCSVRDLIMVTGLSRRTVREHLASLARSDWVLLRRDSGRTVVIPTAPEGVQSTYAKMLKDEYAMAANRGEFTAKLLLGVIVFSDGYVDNARPEFLKSPLSRLPLELDRFYPEEHKGFEYSGAQHYGQTDWFPDQESYEATRTNDLLKLALTKENGITLVIINKKDLTLERMRAKIPPDLPTYTLADGPYLNAVKWICSRYAKADAGETEAEKA
jgi:DNA-binding transcriptional ArsR family regulator